MTKRFSTTAFGYDKKQVEDAIEQVTTTLVTMTKDKDDALNKVKSMQSLVAQANQERDEVLAQKALITETLISAQAKAEAIIQDATREANVEKARLEAEISNAEIRLNHLNDEIARMKDRILNV